MLNFTSKQKDFQVIIGKSEGLSSSILQDLQSPESPAGEVLGQVRESALHLHFSLAVPFFKVN